MLYFSFFLSVTLAMYALMVFGEDRRKQVKRRIALITEASSVKPGPPGPDEAEEKSRALAGLVGRVWARGWAGIKRRFSRRLTEKQEQRLELRLLQAGRPFGLGPVEFRLLQLGLSLFLPVLAGLYVSALGEGIGTVIVGALLGWMVAAFLPGYYLRMKSQGRSRLALKELPDVLDMLTVSLEAGLGFDAALSKLVSKSEGVLTAEFQRCLEEIRLGKTRRESLQGVRERLDLDEVKALISSILQAEKLGIGLVQVLRVQSHEVREQRKQRAEEAAMKAPIKMLFPLVLFIFPSLFIVLLGPAVIQFIEAFSK